MTVWSDLAFNSFLESFIIVIELNRTLNEKLMPKLLRPKLKNLFPKSPKVWKNTHVGSSP